MALNGEDAHDRSPSSTIFNSSTQQELLRISSPPPLPLKEQQALHPPSGPDPQPVVPDTPRINLVPLSPLIKTPN